MLHIVLYQPEIPPNTGNVMRLCANAGMRLHLIEPLGFAPDDAKLRRAGLDYGDWAQVARYSDFSRFLEEVGPARVFAFSTRGRRSYAEVAYRVGDVLVFGPETRGLPQSLLHSIPTEQRVILPMVAGSRSLNLSNTVAIAVYEAWRQLGFAGAKVLSD